MDDAGEIVSVVDKCLKCGKLLEDGVIGFKCDFCTRVSEKLIGLQLAMYRNDLDDIDEWLSIRSRLKRMFGSECTTEKLVENLIDHVQLELSLDADAALNVSLSDVLDLLNRSVNEKQTAAPVIEPVGRRGRLPKTESDLLKTNMLAHLREHPTLADDPARLATLVGVSEPTARRFIESERMKFAEMNRRE